MFRYIDGAGVTVAAKFDPVQITGYWAKRMEGRNADTSDDSDMYGLQLSAKVDTFTIGGYGFYFNVRQYPLSSTTNGTAYGTSALDSIACRCGGWDSMRTGRLGPVNINFDFIYDNG